LRCLDCSVEDSSFASNLRDALPNASFIGFTGTPVEKTDANRRVVIGDFRKTYELPGAAGAKVTMEDIVYSVDEHSDDEVRGDAAKAE